MDPLSTLGNLHFTNDFLRLLGNDFLALLLILLESTILLADHTFDLSRWSVWRGING